MGTAALSAAQGNLLAELRDSIEHRLGTLNKAKVNYRRYYNGFALALVAFSAMNTVVVALSQLKDGPPFWGYLALVISAAITILSGVDGLIKPREKHGQNADALNEVYDLHARLGWRAASGPMTDDEVNKFFEEFRKLEKSFFASMVKINLQDK